MWDDAQPYYAIFLEEQDGSNEPLLKDFLSALEHELGEQNVEYAAKRESGRLGPVRAIMIPPGTWHQWDRST